MVRTDFLNTCLIIPCPKYSELYQKLLFSFSIRWAEGGMTIQHTNEKMLYVDDRGTLTFGPIGGKIYKNLKPEEVARSLQWKLDLKKLSKFEHSLVSEGFDISRYEGMINNYNNSEPHACLFISKLMHEEAEEINFQELLQVDYFQNPLTILKPRIFRNTKFQFSSDIEIILFQKLMFSIGIYWMDTGKKLSFDNWIIVNNEKVSRICINNNLEMSWCNHTFAEISNLELKVNEVSTFFTWKLNYKGLDRTQKQEFDKVHNLKIINYPVCVVFRGGSIHTNYYPLGEIPELSYSQWKSIYNNSNVSTMEKQQSLTKKQLLTLYANYPCHEWREAIKKILEPYLYELDSVQVPISPYYIEMLIRKGLTTQKEEVEKLGIVLKKDLSVDVTSFIEDEIIQIRKSGEYLNKGFYLSRAYNWEIKTDSSNSLVLVPTKKP